MVDARFIHRAALYVALAVALIGAVALPALAAPVLTIADGPVQVLRGAARFDAAEGLALADDDIVRTTDATRVARIEFADGRVLDLGPGTQALLLSDAAAGTHGMAGAGAVIAQGWIKLAAPAGTPARVALPGMVVAASAGGTVLVHAAADGAALAFAESRTASLLPRGGNGREASLREGESWTRDAQSPHGVVAARSALLREVPRSLADTLPRRASRFAGRTVEPAEGQPLDASDLAAWLRAEPALLAQLRPRIAALTRNNLAPQRVKPVVAQAARTHTSRRPAAQTASAYSRAKAARSRVEPNVASASGDEVLLVPGLAAPEPAAALISAQALPPTSLLTAEGVLTGLPAVARIAPAKRY